MVVLQQFLYVVGVALGGPTMSDLMVKIALDAEATDSSLAGLLSIAPRVEEIEVRGSPHITDAGLLALGHFQHLKKVCLAGCNGITLEGVTKFKRLHPRCETVFGRTIDDRVRCLTAGKKQSGRKRA